MDVVKSSSSSVPFSKRRVQLDCQTV